MALSIKDEDARDLELQREMQEAYEAFLHATGDERPIAKGHYLKLVGAFSARVLGRQARFHFRLCNVQFRLSNLSHYRAWAFRDAAQRRFVASMIALRPAGLSFRFLRTGAVDEAAPDCFLAAAHLFRWAAAILARAAADILRPTGVGPLPSGALGFNIWRSPAI
jgi:hypothetical protein